MKPAVKLAIFASGAGSNAERIIRHFKNSLPAKIELIVCNKPAAGVLQVAQEHNIDTLLINREDFFGTDKYIHQLKEKKIDLIILAGFLWKIPENMVKSFPDRIINIHPALLPKFGGKGMYGHFVHEAVIASRERTSGITIHLVDEHYDNGKHLAQISCIVEQDDTPDTLAEKIHRLEHEFFPKTIEKFIENNF